MKNADRDIHHVNKCPRSVLITGAGRGIGLGIAEAFASLGDRVSMISRTDTLQLDLAVNKIRTQGGQVIGICADFSDYEKARQAFEETESAHGPVEILINNAGTAHYGLFTDMSPAQWQEVLGNNLLTAIHGSHLALPNMVKAKSGVIVNITSIWGLAGASCEAVYSAAKGGICAFTKALAKEYGPSGIRVNAIACGAFETRMNEGFTQDEKDAFIENIPAGRFGKPEEVGSLAVYLASPEAEYLTGQVTVLDGGVL